MTIEEDSIFQYSKQRIGDLKEQVKEVEAEIEYWTEELKTRKERLEKAEKELKDTVTCFEKYYEKYPKIRETVNKYNE